MIVPALGSERALEGRQLQRAEPLGRLVSADAGGEVDVLSVVTERRGGTLVLTPEGDVDMHSTRTLRGALEMVLSDGREAVVVNLAGVSFMDSTGLALMLNAARRLTRHKRPFAIACPDGPIRRAFHVSGMEDFFVIRPALDDALADAQPAFSRWPVA